MEDEFVLVGEYVDNEPDDLYEPWAEYTKRNLGEFFMVLREVFEFLLSEEALETGLYDFSLL